MDSLLVTLVGVLIALSMLGLLLFSAYRVLLYAKVRKFRYERLLKKCADPAQRVEALCKDVMVQLALLDIAFAPRETLRGFTQRLDRVLTLPGQEFKPIGHMMEHTLYALQAPTEEEALLLYSYHAALEKELLHSLGKSEHIKRRVLRRSR